jgi:hypothetical protein
MRSTEEITVGIWKTAATVAVASSVHGRVQPRQQQRWGAQDQAAPAPPPQAPAAPASPDEMSERLAQLSKLGDLKTPAS